jgi:hypothetical protein
MVPLWYGSSPRTAFISEELSGAYRAYQHGKRAARFSSISMSFRAGSEVRLYRKIRFLTETATELVTLPFISSI